MTKRKKSFAEAAKDISQSTTKTTTEDTDQTIAFHKFTVPLRTDQLERIDQALAKLTIEKHINFKKAALIRLSIDRLLDRLEEDPDQVIYDLWIQEQEELAGNENRKFSVSKGAEEYLTEIGRL